MKDNVFFPTETTYVWGNFCYPADRWGKGTLLCTTYDERKLHIVFGISVKIINQQQIHAQFCHSSYHILSKVHFRKENAKNSDQLDFICVRYWHYILEKNLSLIVLRYHLFVLFLFLLSHCVFSHYLM